MKGDVWLKVRRLGEALPIAENIIYRGPTPLPDLALRLARRAGEILKSKGDRMSAIDGSVTIVGEAIPSDMDELRAGIRLGLDIVKCVQ